MRVVMLGLLGRFFILNTECMDFLERDLETIIWEADNETLREKGLYVDGIKKRQLRIGNYGIADIVCISKQYTEPDEKPYLLIDVLELKKDNAGISAFLQALRYVKGIDTYLKYRKVKFDYKFSITLVAKKIDTNSSYIFLSDFMKNYYNNELFLTVTNYSYKYTIDGIIFKEECDYNIINTGF